MAKVSEIEKKGSSSPQAATNKCVVGVAVDCRQVQVVWREGEGHWQTLLEYFLLGASAALPEGVAESSDGGILVARLLSLSSQDLESLGSLEGILTSIKPVVESLSVGSHFSRPVPDFPSLRIALDRVAPGRLKALIQGESLFAPTVADRTLDRNLSPVLRDVEATSCVLWTSPSTIATASPSIESLVRSHFDTKQKTDEAYRWKTDLPKSDQLLVNALSAAAEYLLQDWVVARKDAGMDLPSIGAFLLQVSDDRLHGAFVVQERDNLRLQAASGSMRREAQAHLDSDVSFANHIAEKVIFSLREQPLDESKSGKTASWQLRWPADKVVGSSDMEMAEVKFLALPSEGSDFTASTTELSWFLRSTPEVCHTDVLGAYLRSMLPFLAHPDGLGEISKDFSEVDSRLEESKSPSTTEPFFDLSSESFTERCEQFISWLEVEKKGLPDDMIVRAVKNLDDDSIIEVAKMVRSLSDRIRRKRKTVDPEALAIGRRIHERRNASKLTQKELAKRSGVYQENISAYENGSTRATIVALRRIAVHLKDTSVLWLETGKN